MPALESATVSSQPDFQWLDVCISLQGVPCPSDKPKHTYYQKFILVLSTTSTRCLVRTATRKNRKSRKHHSTLCGHCKGIGTMIYQAKWTLTGKLKQDLIKKQQKKNQQKTEGIWSSSWVWTHFELLSEFRERLAYLIQKCVFFNQKNQTILWANTWKNKGEHPSILP